MACHMRWFTGALGRYLCLYSCMVICQPAIGTAECAEGTTCKTMELHDAEDRWRRLACACCAAQCPKNPGERG